MWLRILRTHECVVPNVDTILQSGRFWATSIASFRERFNDSRSCWVVFIHVSTRGRKRKNATLLVTDLRLAISNCQLMHGWASMSWATVSGPHVSWASGLRCRSIAQRCWRPTPSSITTCHSCPRHWLDGRHCCTIDQQTPVSCHSRNQTSLIDKYLPEEQSSQISPQSDFKMTKP